MSDSLPVADSNLTNTSTQPETPVKKSRRKIVWFLGLGCLAPLVCLGVSVIGLLVSGVLSGPKGDSDEYPAWSPDGSQITFSSTRNGYTDIYVMEADGSHVTQLTRDPFAQLYFLQSPTDTMPAWSPDGRQIAFISGRDNGMMSYINLHIYSMNADGSNVVELTRDSSVDSDPIWSPDSNKILFVAAEKFTPNHLLIENSTWGIDIMNSDGSGQKQLTSEASNAYGPAWSPDGSQIAYVSEHNGNPDIYLMKANGSGSIPLTTESTGEGSPTWSPDGTQIAFVSDRDGGVELYVMNADGSNVVQLTDNLAGVYAPNWSPKSQQIVFYSDHDGDTDIYVINADGSGLTQLTGQ